jgi:hypothetical protein
MAAGMAQHVRMGLEIEASAGGDVPDHPGESGRRERGSPLADEDEGRGLALALELAQRRRRLRPPWPLAALRSVRWALN